MGWQRLLAAALLLATAAGCDDRTPLVDLRVLPPLALERLAPEAREQIAAARQRLERLLGGGSADRRALGNAYLALGRLYMVYGYPETADAALDNATRLTPDLFEAHYARAASAIGAGDLGVAEAPLMRCLALQADDPASLVALAGIRLQQGRGDEAVDLFRRALSFPDYRAAAHAGLGLVAVDQGRQGDAADHLSRALELQPTASRLHHPLGMAYRDLGEMERAKHHLALRGDGEVSHPEPALAEMGRLRRGAGFHLAEGARLAGAGDVVAALPHLQRAVGLNPDNFQARHNLGAALGKLGRHQEAVAHLRRATELNPGFRDGHFDLATALAVSGEPTAAAQGFSRVMALDPTDVEAGYRRALILEKLGRDEEAGQLLLRLLERHPDHAPSLRAAARARQRQRAHHEAAELYRRLTELTPGEPGVWHQAARSSLLAGRYPEALEALAGGLAQSPSDRPLQHLRARILATCPDPGWRDGPAALELARQVFGQESTLQHGETVAMSYAELGQWDRARQWQTELLEQVRRHDPDGEPVARLERNLARYLARQPVREPWAEAGFAGAARGP